MDISEAVTGFHKMKRGNYAVNASDTGWNNAANSSTSSCVITTTYSRETIVRNRGQEGPSGVCDNAVHKQQTRGSVCSSDCIQGEPIQRGLTEQIQWSSWSMATTMGQTRVVITQTNAGSTRVCASSLRHLVRGAQLPSGKELVLSSESV